MTSMSPELRLALESDCATGVDEVVNTRSAEDVLALRAMLRRDADVPAPMRQNAIQILGRLEDTESAAAIRALVPAFDERERINAVDALGRIGGPDAEAAVLDLSDDESPDVRRFAAYALSRLDTDVARNRLGEMKDSDPMSSTRVAAARSLRHRQ